MPPARPFWKGYLKLSLVSCPIVLYPASSSSERVSFRQINKKTGHRLKQQLVDSVTGEVVESQEKGRGYQIGKDEYMQVEDVELDGLRLESTKIIGLDKFVPRAEIDERHFDSPYYLTPEDKVGQEAFAVIREAMKRKNMVGLGKVVISRRTDRHAGAARQGANGDDAPIRLRGPGFCAILRRPAGYEAAE
jgi:DNA end-binding protein Ku